VKNEIEVMKVPILACVEKVGDDLAKALDECIEKTVVRYPKLRTTVLELVSTHLRKCLKNCRDLLGLLIDLEMEHIDTEHPDFIDLIR
jgi:dynamin 1-like protein